MPLATRCAPAAPWARSAEHRGLPIEPTIYQAIDLATGDCHGTLQSQAEVAACLAFAGLSAMDVEIIVDAPVMAFLTSTSW